MSPSKQSQYAHNYVSQDQIDSLLKGSGDFPFPDGDDPLGNIADFINTDEIDRLLGDDLEDEGDPDVFREDEMSDELPPEEEGFDDEELSMISMDDIQRVLSEDGDEAPDETPLEDLSLNLEEVEALPAENGEEADGDLISQDDIDRLLKNSGVEADDVAEEVEEGFQISKEEIDTLFTDAAQDAPQTKDEGVGEGGQETPASKAKEEGEDEELPPEKPRSKKKLIIMAACLLLLFAGGGAVGWFFLLGGDEPPPVATVTDSGEEVAGIPDSVATGEPLAVSRLENFLIPAAKGNDYAFVSLHVVLTIRGVKTDPIKGYETYYRKRIYDELAAKLAETKGEKPVERELRELVRKTAGTILTEGVIDEVVLENYRLM